MNGAVFPKANPLNVLLPWESTADDERRFRRILQVSAGLFLLFALMMPMLPLEEIVREVRTPEPTPLARVILEPQVIPEPPKPEIRPRVQKKPEPRPKPVPPRPKAQVEPRPVPKPPPKPVDKLKQAKDAAAAAGLLAFKDDLQAMRDTVDVAALNQTQTRRGQASAETLQRAVITREAPGNSGGITTANLSTDTGGAALSGRETTAVHSQLAGKGASSRSNETGPGNQLQTPGGRSDEAIRRVMDKNKGAIFAIYNRALRSDPLLEGKLVFEMVIEPDGTVSALKLLSSELVDDSLTRKILSRIQLIQFGGAAVKPTRVNYSFDFLPYS